ncbi:MAG TPA: glycosyl hydrolase, partial [Verrucomicrobiae bacterium]|nr:glycosyl hydrolase [Verrucomicrobiae bacterium]
EELPSRAILPQRYNPALPAGYAADSINRDALLRLARVKNGRIVLPGGASYAILVLPETPLMSPEVAAKIKKLVKHGATVFGPRPQYSIGLKNFPTSDEKVGKIADILWGSVPSTGSRTHFYHHGRVISETPLELVLQKRGIVPDFIVHKQNGDSAPEIEWTHRSADDGEIYFISNQGDTNQTVEVSLRATKKTADLLNPVSGTLQPARNLVEADGRIILPLRLAPHGSTFVLLHEPVKIQTEPAKGNNWPNLQPLEDLTGSWQVTFESLTTNQIVDFPELTSWSDREEPAIHFYSGTAKYSKSFEWNDPTPTNRVWLDLGSISAMASVSLNGKNCGTVWTQPYRVDITSALQTGTNSLEIRVANTWNNRLIGERSVPQAERKTWTNAPDRPANASLLPAGLLGPVKILGSD